MAGWVLLLVLLGCGGERAALETLYRDGYADLTRGALKAAEAQAEEGRRRAEAADEASWVWAFRVLEAEALASRRDHGAALALLDTGPRSAVPSDRVRVRAAMTRGLIRCRSGEGPEALAEGDALLDDAARLARAMGSVELEGEVDLRRGTCRFAEERWDEAETLFERALAAARRARVPHLKANATGSLGLIRIRTGRVDEAVDWLGRSLAIAEAIGAEVPRAKTINNLGWCHFELGDYERAVTLLSEARARAAALGLDGDRLIAQINLGRSYFELGDLARSRDQYRQALALARKLDDPWRMAQLLSNLALVDLAEGHYDAAETRTGEALEIKEALGDTIGRQHSLVTRIRILVERGHHGEAEALCRRLLEDPATETSLLWLVHGALARLHLEDGRTDEAETHLLRAIDYLEARRQRLHEIESRLAFFSNRKRLYDDTIGLLVASGRERQALDLALRSRARSLLEQLWGQGAEGASAGVDPMAMAGRSKATVLVYWTGIERSLLWRIDAAGFTLHTLPGEEHLAADIETHRRAIEDVGNPLADAAPEGERLWRTLVAPVADELPAGSRVVVVADGALHRLAFDTLVVPGPRPHYWLEDVVLSSAPTLASARSADHPGGALGSILLLGDPETADPAYPRLRHAGSEVRRISELFAPEARQVYSGAAARPSVYAQADPGRFAYIHLAAHVTAHREIPFDSAVLLSPEGERHKLYARDIARIPLAAHLVTLSACRGAGSRTYAGEGLVGLAWAFLGAGAESVIAGLWEVDDASTSELMTHLYRGLVQGLEPDDALRQAKLRLLRSPGEWHKPFYWAPFVLYHGPGALGSGSLGLPAVSAALSGPVVEGLRAR